MDQNVISPLSDCVTISTVSDYADGHQFITYGEVPVWIGNYVRSPRMIVLRVLLNDNMEKIQRQLKEQLKFASIELKSFTINPNEKLKKENWNEGKTLKSYDTIISCQIYQDNCIIMAKIARAIVSWNFSF
jgi:hypothetical protein